MSHYCDEVIQVEALKSAPIMQQCHSHWVPEKWKSSLSQKKSNKRHFICQRRPSPYQLSLLEGPLNTLEFIYAADIGKAWFFLLLVIVAILGEMQFETKAPVITDTS